MFLKVAASGDQGRVHILIYTITLQHDNAMILLLNDPMHSHWHIYDLYKGHATSMQSQIT